MRKATKYTDEPLGEIKVIKDFLLVYLQRLQSARVLARVAARQWRVRPQLHEHCYSQKLIPSDGPWYTLPAKLLYV